MTMPDERARALRWAGELLSELQSSPDVPQDIRSRARTILRHYPSGFEINLREDREARSGPVTPNVENGVEDAP